MPNRFYVPPPKEGYLGGFNRQAGELLQSERANAMNSARTNLMREDLALRGRAEERQQRESVMDYGTPGGAPGFKQQGMDIAKQNANTARAQVPVHQQNFSEDDANGILEELKQTGGDKLFKPLLDSLQVFAKNPKANQGRVYQTIKAQWPAYQKMMTEHIGKELEKEVDPARAQLLQDVMEELQKDTKGQMVDMFFPDVGRALQLETAKIAASMPKPEGPKVVGSSLVSPEGRVLYQGQENQWSAPYKDETGILLQRNEKSGEIKKIASPPTGWTIESDGQGGFKMVQGPASGGSLSKATQGQLEKDIVAMTDQLQALKPTLENYSSDLLTYWGRGKRLALNTASKAGIDIGEEGRDFVKRGRMVNEGLEYVFNLYRKNITGAQAVMKELSMLRESILNKELSPDEFKSSVDRFIDLGTRSINLRLTLLKEGVNETTINSAINDLARQESKKRVIGRFQIEEE